MAHSVPLFRTRKGPAWSFAGVGRRVLQLEVPGVTLTPLEATSSSRLLGKGVALLHHLATLAQVCWVKQSGNAGLGPFFPSALPSAFLPHSFVPPTRTALHSPRPAIHAPTGSFIPRPAAIPSAAPECTWLPAPPGLPQRPPASAPRLGAAGGAAESAAAARGAGAGGEPGWGRGAGAPCGKPGGLGGAPAAPRLRARSASEGRVRAGGGGGSGSGTRARRRRRLRRRRRAARLPRGHVDGRPAAGPAPPGGEYPRARRAGRGRGRGGGAGATHAAARSRLRSRRPACPLPRGGRQSSLCSPASGAPSGAAARGGSVGGSQP